MNAWVDFGADGSWAQAGDQIAGVPRLDVTLAELGREPFQQPDLVVGELDLALCGGLLQPQQAFVPGQQIMPAPHAAHSARGDLHALERELLGDAQRAMGRMVEAMRQDGGLDLLGDPVGVRASGAGQPVDQPVRPVCLVVAPDLVELLTRVSHDPAGPGDIAHLGGQFEQAELAPCYLVFGGHVVLLKGWMFVQNNPNPDQERRGHRRRARLLRSRADGQTVR